MTDIRWISAIPSTNTALRDEPIGSVLATLNQTSGRGRLGRDWIETPGKGLAISLVISPTSIPTLIPLVAGAALVAVLRERGVDSWTKWPNDVYIGDRKVAGILTEMPSADRVIVGLGVNVRYSRDELPLDTATSLAAEGFDIDATDIAERWLVVVRERLNTIGTIALLDWVRAASGIIGRDVTIEFPDDTVHTATVATIAANGALELATGELVVAGDITRLRPVE